MRPDLPGSGRRGHWPRRGSDARSSHPSKLQRPHGDRVKTDAKDALHLARLLRLDDYAAVSVPSGYPSGQSRIQGPVTKTGNPHVRRLLIEAAWQHRARYVAGKTMRERWDTFRERRKRHVVAKVTIARELAGWCWSLAVLEG